MESMSRVESAPGYRKVVGRCGLVRPAPDAEQGAAGRGAGLDADEAAGRRPLPSGGGVDAHGQQLHRIYPPVGR